MVNRQRNLAILLHCGDFALLTDIACVQYGVHCCIYAWLEGALLYGGLHTFDTGVM